MKVHVLSLPVFRQFLLSRIQILVDMTGKTKGKRFKSIATLSNPSTMSSSKCERSILLQGGSVRRCEKTSISGLPSITPSVLEYLKEARNTIIKNNPVYAYYSVTVTICLNATPPTKFYLKKFIK